MIKSRPITRHHYRDGKLRTITYEPPDCYCTFEVDNEMCKLCPSPVRKGCLRDTKAEESQHKGIYNGQ